jgi:hypothetical protein
MTQPKRIGLDFDGVIVDHSANKLKLAEGLGCRLEHWQTNTNVMKRFLRPETYEAIQDCLYYEFTPLADPMDGALENIARLVAAGIEPHIISARDDRSRPFAMEWIQKYRLTDMIPPERLHFVGSGDDKRALVESLGISSFLDDKMAVLAHLPETTRRYLFDQHDIAKQIDLAGSDAVVRTWKEFVDLVG